MTTTLQKIAIFSLLFATGVGATAHDLHLEYIAPSALGFTGAIALQASVGMGLGDKMDHTHIERAGFMKASTTSSHSKLPNAQPRDDQYRYVQNKKVALNGGGSGSALWPSV